MRMSGKKMFANWRRVEEDPAKAFNKAFVDFTLRNGILTPWERDFYMDTWRLRAMTHDQARKRKQINFKALREIRSRRGDHQGIGGHQSASSRAPAEIKADLDSIDRDRRPFNPSSS